MENIKFYRDSNAVKIAVAQAQGKPVDSDLLKETDALIKEQTSDLNPQNKYAIAQFVGFAVNEMLKPASNWMDNIADVKRVGFGDKAQFKVHLPGIKAFIQAKGATTARSKVADKTMSLDTIAISARPVINIVELQAGRVQMSDLIVEAAYQMELAQAGYIQQTLNNTYKAAGSLATPYYASGTGVVKATIDPQIRFWTRMSAGAAPTVIGDIDMTSQLAALTGFAADTSASTLQHADAIIVEQNNAGYIGRYMGANVINLMNPVIDGSDDFVFDRDRLFILPSGLDASMRPLKVVFEGDVVSQEQSNIDDKSYEIRLDQFVGAGMAYGDRPYMSVYEDTNL